jgi:tetratricopeptide (TPR) repeat protein
MSTCNRTYRSVLTLAASAWLTASLLYMSGGCTSGTAAKSGTALDSYVQGVLAYQSGDSVKAMANLQDAVAKKDDMVIARSMLGDLYRAKGSHDDYEAAREQYEAVARLDPYEYLNHYHLGLVYQLLERLQDATASYLKALNLKPEDAKSNMQLGTVYYQLNQPKEALKYAERAAQYEPDSAGAWVNFGLILDANGQYDRAEKAYRKSLDLDSSNTGTRLYLGENLLMQKKYPEAASVLSELVKVEDSPLHRKRLGDAYAGAAKVDDAFTQYRAALKLDPNYYPALNAMGELYIIDYNKGLGLDDGKRKAALDVWQQSLAIKRTQANIMARVQQYAKAPMFTK